MDTGKPKPNADAKAGESDSHGTHSASDDRTEIEIDRGSRSDPSQQASTETVDFVSAADRSIPGYEIIEMIGSGGMGVVYRARQLTLDRVVALKTIQPDMTASGKAVGRFEQEAKAIAKLKHPNIVSAHDFGRDGDLLFLVMELVDGEELTSMIRRHERLDEWTAWCLVRQLAAGLSHAENHGITHRDVKPSNVLVIPAPEGYELPVGVPMAKLTDFGLALLGTGSQDGAPTAPDRSTCGSPAYMAPELFSGGVAGRKADIYSLGMTLYHMLVGEAPMASESVSATIRAKVNDELPSLSDRRSDLHPATIELFDRMTAHRPDQRLDDYGVLIDSIADVIGVLESEPKSRGKKNRRFAMLIAVIGITLACALGLAVSNYTRQPSEKTLVPTGQSIILLDGQSLDLQQWRLEQSRGGWSVRRGELVHEPHSSSPYLVGRAPPWDHFVLSTNVRLENESVAEMHFQIVTRGQNQERCVIRLDSARAELGQSDGPPRPAASSAFRSSGASVALDPDRETHHIQMERQPDDWWISVDGQLLGTVPTIPHEQRPDFAFSVPMGNAAFSEIDARQLAKPDDDLSSNDGPP